MTPFSLYPAFVRIFYTTAYAPHTMTIPVLDWNPPSGGHPSGTFLAHDASQADAEAMIDALVADLADIFLATTTINEAIIYTMDAAVAPAIPQVTYEIGVVGTNANTGWAQAVQLTFTLRTDLFHKMKLVLLDVPSDNDFNKYSSLVGLNAEFVDLVELLETESWGWCGRDRGKPTTFVSMIFDLNDGLRKRYNLG